MDFSYRDKTFIDKIGGRKYTIVWGSLFAVFWIPIIYVSLGVAETVTIASTSGILALSGWYLKKNVDNKSTNLSLPEGTVPEDTQV